MSGSWLGPLRKSVKLPVRWLLHQVVKKIYLIVVVTVLFFYRPLSKTVKFNTLKITKASGNKKSFKKF